jgi:hypothetical protein
MNKPVLDMDLIVITHEIAPTGFTEVLPPFEYYSALKKRLKGQYKVRLLEDNEVDTMRQNGTIRIGNWRVYCQSDEMGKPDEYVVFKKGTPKSVVDKSLAVLVGKVSGDWLHTLKEEKSPKTKEQMKLTEEKLQESRKVLKGESSYWDTTLKDYVLQEKSDGENIFDALIVNTYAEKFARKKMLGNPAEAYAASVFLEWKHEQSAKAKTWRNPTFEKELEEKLKLAKEEKISMLLSHMFERIKERTGNPCPDIRQFRERYASYAGQVLEDKEAMKRVVAMGEQIYPEYEGDRNVHLQILGSP